MCSYYRRFVPNFSKIAEPLIDLTKKYARFKWTSECQTAFDFLKESLTVVPLLAYPDTNKPYVLYTDASNNCIGACLTQKTDDEEEKPIYFLSHKLSQTQTRWSTIEKEGFAIYYALQKLDHYLHNAKFTIKTDHKPLKYILDSPMQNKKIQLWALSIAGYNTQVEYIKGKENHCADLLSRIPFKKGEKEELQQSKSTPEDEELDIDDRSLEIGAINSNEINPRDFASSHVDPPGDVIKPDIDLPEDFNMVEEQQKDEEIGKLKNRINKGTATKAEQTHYFETEDGLLYYLSQPDSRGSETSTLHSSRNGKHRHQAVPRPTWTYGIGQDLWLDEAEILLPQHVPETQLVHRKVCHVSDSKCKEATTTASRNRHTTISLRQDGIGSIRTVSNNHVRQ